MNAASLFNCRQPRMDLCSSHAYFGDFIHTLMIFLLEEQHFVAHAASPGRSIGRSIVPRAEGSACRGCQIICATMLLCKRARLRTIASAVKNCGHQQPREFRRHWPSGSTARVGVGAPIQHFSHVVPVPNSKRTDDNKDVITTPIFYVNAEPHLGHLYSALLCDARARWSRLRGRQVLFTTGTDEHGLKIEEAADRSECGTPGAFCDKVAQSFVDCFSAFGISYDDFIRTTEPRHADTVRALWRRLQSRGSIYLGTHRGWYCKSDESYLTEAQTLEVPAPPLPQTSEDADDSRRQLWTRRWCAGNCFLFCIRLRRVRMASCAITTIATVGRSY